MSERRCLRRMLVLLVCVGSALAHAQRVHLPAAGAELAGPTVRIARPAEAAASGVEDPDRTAYATGFEQPADRLRFRFKVQVPGEYSLELRYRSPQQKGYEVTVNGEGLSGLLRPTAGIGFGKQDLGRVELREGQNEVTIHRGWGFYDIASLDVLPAVKPHAPLPVDAPPVDPAATPEARALLSRLEAGYGKTTALGVYAAADAAYVVETTGVRPAIMGGDLMRVSPEFVAHEPVWQDDPARLIAAAQAGYTVTLSWHWASPTGGLDTAKSPWWRSFYTDGTTFDASRAVDPSTPEHAAALADLDAIAVQLRRLQDAHVPVLFRPLHEAQGGWFWWGAKGPAVYRQLWAMVYDRLTSTDGIHNLLWVYTSAEDPAWYPGDSRVDIVGIDAYPTDLHETESNLWDELLREHDGRKPLAITEFGGVPDVPRMQRYGEPWLYAVSWSAELGPKKNSPGELKRIYASPEALVLPAIPEANSPVNSVSRVPSETSSTTHNEKAGPLP